MKTLKTTITGLVNGNQVTQAKAFLIIAAAAVVALLVLQAFNVIDLPKLTTK